ncbi:MAG: hypothetical protein QOF76_4120 [Solirubrobacteraceae bacterium]|jgi:hypothetical protein|nr:hypothetical protein [Solirubrobacteraceae bacterium]
MVAEQSDQDEVSEMDLDDHVGFFVMLSVDLLVMGAVFTALIRAAVLDGR